MAGLCEGRPGAEALLSEGGAGPNVEGLATIECRALSNGETTACAWITETPPGYGLATRPRPWAASCA